MSDLIRLKNVEKKYKNGVTAIHNLNLAIEKGSFVFVIGGSGSGKSTLINRISKKNSVKTGNKAGVTKGISWVRVGNTIELMDTPGILYPKIEDQRVAYNLATFSSIKDEILPIDEVACYILKYM